MLASRRTHLREHLHVVIEHQSDRRSIVVASDILGVYRRAVDQIAALLHLLRLLLLHLRDLVDDLLAPSEEEGVEERDRPVNQLAAPHVSGLHDRQVVLQLVLLLIANANAHYHTMQTVGDPVLARTAETDLQQQRRQRLDEKKGRAGTEGLEAEDSTVSSNMTALIRTST